MIADEIEILEKTGKLKMLLRTGIISTKIKCQYDMYKYYQLELIKNKHLKDKIMQSAENTSIAFGISLPTVFRAIKLMTL